MKKSRFLNTAILDMVIWYKAKVQVSKAEMNRRVRRPRKLKTLLIECGYFFGE